MGYGETRDVGQHYEEHIICYIDKGVKDNYMRLLWVGKVKRRKKYVHFSKMLKSNSKSMVAVVIVKRNAPRAHCMN